MAGNNDILELRDIIPEGPAAPPIKYVPLMCCLGTSVQASSINATERTHPRHPNNARCSTLNTELTWIFRDCLLS